MIWHKWLLGDALPKMSKYFDRLKNMALRGWDQFFPYVIIGVTSLKIFLSKSTWWIENNSTLMVIEWLSTKIVHIFIGWKNRTARGGVCFSIWKNLLQIFLSKYYLVKLFQEYHQSVKQLRSKQLAFNVVIITIVRIYTWQSFIALTSLLVSLKYLI